MITQYLEKKNIGYKTDLPLSKYSTMKVGGTAKLAVFPSSEAELCELLHYLDSTGEEYTVIGRGSNVVFPDGTLKRTLIFTEKLCQVNFDKNKVTVSAGYSLTSLSREALKRSLSGLEFAYGIPGSLGGAVFMNAGAYGSEISNIVESVTAYSSRDMAIRNYTNEECKYSYRHSIFQENTDLTVISAKLSLIQRSSNEDITRKMKENMALRAEKQPLELPNAGSAFKRPSGYFAGKLIEDADLKGVRVGDAAVSEKHAGFIVNLGSATCADVKALIELIQRSVYDKFGVMLEPEIKFIK